MIFDVFCGQKFINLIIILKYVSSPFCDVLFLTKSHITIQFRPIDNFPLFISLFYPSFRLLFCLIISIFRFHTLTLLLLKLQESVSPLLLYDNFFVDNIFFQGLQMMLRVLLKVCMQNKFCIYDHYLPSYFSITIFPDPSYLFPTPKSILKMFNGNISVPPSCDLLSSLREFFVSAEWISVSDIKVFGDGIFWDIMHHCYLHYIPAQPLASSICAKFLVINIFWFHVFHRAKTF